MHNPDFWEVSLEPLDLAQHPNEAGIWFESIEDRLARFKRAARVAKLIRPIMDLVYSALTQKQREVLILYFFHQKTQEEVAQIMGISRRVVSQHLFGVCRNGKQVGGAIKKLQKLCREQGIIRKN